MLSTSQPRLDPLLLPVSGFCLQISPVLAGDGTASHDVPSAPDSDHQMAHDRGSVEFLRGRGKVALLKNVSVSCEDKF